MRILVISRSAWRNDNNTGNTLSDFFSDMSDSEIYSLCMREQLPQNNIVRRHFYISEIQILKNLLSSRARIIAEHSIMNENDSSEKIIYDTAKKYPNYLLYFAREILWCIGNWKNNQLKECIDNIKPDIIFFPVFGFCYPHKVLCHVQSMSDAKIVLFHADDTYTLKQFSLSPFYWLYRFELRKWVRRSVNISDLQYCISDIQKVDYDEAFKCKCKLLTKFSDFSGKPILKESYGNPIQLVYTGNIGINRWKSLKIIADVLERINEDSMTAQLRIYTATPLTKKMERVLNRGTSSIIMGTVSASEVPQIQRDADILVHVEALDLKNRLAVRQSFSTKIVDYLKAARPILAVGPKDVASIDHLIRNDCAIVADNRTELEQKLREVLENPGMMNSIVENAYECGRKYHNKETIQKMLREDLETLCKQ